MLSSIVNLGSLPEFLMMRDIKHLLAMSAQCRGQQQAHFWVTVMFLKGMVSLHGPPTLSSN